MKGGLLVKEARLRAGLTQAQLAARLKTSQSVVARWESGKQSPSFDTVARAVRACGLDLGVRLTPYDDHDIGLAVQTMRLGPDERVAQLLHLLEVERWAHAARAVGPVVGRG